MKNLLLAFFVFGLSVGGAQAAVISGQYGADFNTDISLGYTGFNNDGTIASVKLKKKDGGGYLYSKDLTSDLAGLSTASGDDKAATFYEAMFGYEKGSVVSWAREDFDNGTSSTFLTTVGKFPEAVSVNTDVSAGEQIDFNSSSLAIQGDENLKGYWYVNESELLNPSRVIGFLLKGGQGNVWIDFGGDTIGFDTLIAFNTIGWYVDELGLSLSNGNDEAGFSHITVFGDTSITPIPVPAALPLLATALGGLGFISWRRKRRLAA